MPSPEPSHSLSRATLLPTYLRKPRVFILSDISNEPDDAESLVRYLLYANQFCTEGLVAVTSTWMKTRVCPQDMEKIIEAYSMVVKNLNAHVHPESRYPEAKELKGLIRSGAECYGMEAIGDNIPLSDGAKLLLEKLEESADPLWVLCWGGTNVLAQVLFKLQNRPASEAAQIRARLRVYAISDQDDTGCWIRQTFPDIFYICSVHGWNQYGLATWTGISGDKYYGFDEGGPDFSKLTKEWIKENIQIGPLGSVYPDYLFIPEGDTPTFLYLIQNGLGVSECPEYGSWGGRYALTDISGKLSMSRHYGDTVDRVIGSNGKRYTSNQATIWRWREAYQNDFAARIQWTLTGDFQKANHHPVVIVNGHQGLAPLRFEEEAGTTITLDASQSYDPDGGDELTFDWTHYRDPSASQWWVEAEVAEIKIKKLDPAGRRVELELPPPEKCCVELISRKAIPKGHVLHVILEVKDNGKPQLTSYRRIVIQTTNKDLRGGGEGGDAIGDVMNAHS